MSRNRLTTPGLAVVLALLAAACSEPQEPLYEPPPEPVSLAEYLPPAPGINVLIISFDALRQDYVGAYGRETGMTPHMDAFAAEGLVFENAYTAGQATPSSFAAAFTGRYPLKTLRKWALIDTDTIADVFRSAGYRTGGVFNNVHLIPERNYHQGYDNYSVSGNQHDNEPLQAIKDFLSEPSDQPFFGWVHFINPHSPYLRRDMASQFYSDDYEGDFAESSGGRIQGYKPDEMSEADIKRLNELYRGEVYFADHRFGQVIRHLESLDLLDNTLVVVTADHGEAELEHGLFGHTLLYEEVVRIPLLMRHPNGKRPAHIAARAMNMDLLPTLAGIADVPYADDLDGVDLSQTFNAARPIILTAMTNQRYYAMAIQRQGHKFLSRCGRRRYWEELYDLDNDPGEQTDIIDLDPALAEELFVTLEAIAGDHPCDAINDAIGGVGKFDNVDEETLRKLRSLGYIQ